jgi:hypothetical protein
MLGLVFAALSVVPSYGAEPGPGACVLQAPAGQSTLGDYVWHDTNKDGWEAGEEGIDNVLVKLFMDNGDGSFESDADAWVDQMYTGDDPASTTIEHGWYTFKIGVTDALYWVVIDDSNFAGDGELVGWTHTSAGTKGPEPMPVYLPPGVQNYTYADFGYVSLLAAIGDTVWYDTDGDGQQDGGELGIANIQICATAPGDGTVICEFTSIDGKYEINVPAGTYTIAPTNPPLGYAASTLVPHGPITLSPGQSYWDADFGYVYPTAVEVLEFTARSANDQVRLRWTVLGEAPDGFRIWRADNIKGAGAHLVTEVPVSVDASGKASFTDTTVAIGLTYWYWLENMDDGQRFGPVSVTVRGDSGEPRRIYLPFIRRW